MRGIITVERFFELIDACSRIKSGINKGIGSPYFINRSTAFTDNFERDGLPTLFRCFDIIVVAEEMN